MLTWLAGASLVAAVVAAIRWWLRRVDSLGRARPFPVLSVALLAVAGVGLLVPVVRHGQLEDRLDSAASALVGVPVQVHCQTAGKQFIDAGVELGYVRYGPDGVPERETLIKRKQCRDLAHYLGSSRERPSEAEVVAVHVLTHEVMHMSGVTDEAGQSAWRCRATRAPLGCWAPRRRGRPGWPGSTGASYTRGCPSATSRPSAGREASSTSSRRTPPGCAEVSA